jgi:hypothetical protein
MNELYTDKTYIDIVLEQLKEAVEDIEKISVYNDDFLNEESSNLAERVTAIREKIEKRFK